MQGLGIGEAHTSNYAGMTNLLSYAFGQNIETFSPVPLAYEIQSGGEMQSRIKVPETGMQRDVVVEYSPDLMTPFQAISEIFSGVGILEKGQVTDEVITLPSSVDRRGFIRLRVE